jgi:hypothetical protein
MRTIIIPFVVKKQKGKLTRQVYNEYEYIKNFDELKSEVRRIYNSIPNMEVSFNEVLGQVINAGKVNDEHCLFTLKDITIKMININKIPQYHSVESIAKSIN